jgi:Prenyltransferase and squalene oxidase repeat
MLALAIGAGAAGSTTLAGAAEPQHGKLVDGIVAFLESHETENGAYADTGKNPTQGISAWVTMAVAAAGVNPLDQTRFVGGAPCGIAAAEYLEAGFPASARAEAGSGAIPTTAFERELLVVDTSGADPHDFAGFDLVAEIAARQDPVTGGIPYVPGGESQVNDAVFGILALAPVQEPEAEAALAAAARWLLTAHDPDGGYNWRGPGSASEVDLTGAAIEALNAAGLHGAPAEAEALAYLETAQRPDGGFAEYPGTEAESNVASTAWATQGIWASGGDPETWTVGEATPPAEPLDYMESLQQSDGHIRWKASSDLNGIWMTAYALPAFTGQVMPYPYVPRSEAGGERLASCDEDTAVPGSPTGEAGGGSPPPVEAGSPPPGGTGGGDPPVSGDRESPSAGGVGAGGGGEGAPDFSRPKPGSKGRTPGGARVVHHGLRGRVSDRSRTRRGSNQHQAQGTETAEPRSASEADLEVAVVSGAAGTGSTSGGEPDRPTGGDGSGHGGAPLPTEGARHVSPTTTGREVSGVVIGAPRGGDGKLAFGAPGLRSASASGGGGEPWVPLAIGAAALALLGLGARRELRGGGPRRPLGTATGDGGGRPA